jgi:hypothetical protein
VGPRLGWATSVSKKHCQFQKKIISSENLRKLQNKTKNTNLFRSLGLLVAGATRSLGDVWIMVRHLAAVKEVAKQAPAGYMYVVS